LDAKDRGGQMSDLASDLGCGSSGLGCDKSGNSFPVSAASAGTKNVLSHDFRFLIFFFLFLSMGWFALDFGLDRNFYFVNVNKFRRKLG
jgi:hypothetical protein